MFFKFSSCCKNHMTKEHSNFCSPSESSCFALLLPLDFLVFLKEPPRLKNPGFKITLIKTALTKITLIRKSFEIIN